MNYDNTKKSNVSDPFIRVLESCLALVLLDYFIDKNSYSNKCVPFINLLQCNRSIYKLLINYFFKRKLFTFSNTLVLDIEKTKISN